MVVDRRAGLDPPRMSGGRVAEVLGEVMAHPQMAEDMLEAGYAPFVVGYDEVADYKQSLYDRYVPVAEAIRN